MALPMRYGSVCSGIEAATMAWHPLDLAIGVLCRDREVPVSGAGASLLLACPTGGDITKFKKWPDAAIDVSWLAEHSC